MPNPHLILSYPLGVMPMSLFWGLGIPSLWGVSMIEAIRIIRFYVD